MSLFWFNFGQTVEATWQLFTGYLRPPPQGQSLVEEYDYLLFNVTSAATPAFTNGFLPPWGLNRELVLTLAENSSTTAYLVAANRTSDATMVCEWVRVPTGGQPSAPAAVARGGWEWQLCRHGKSVWRQNSTHFARVSIPVAAVQYYDTKSLANATSQTLQLYVPEGLALPLYIALVDPNPAEDDMRSNGIAYNMRYPVQTLQDWQILQLPVFPPDS
jgi:hypothetical protein